MTGFEEINNMSSEQLAKHIDENLDSSTYDTIKLAILFKISKNLDRIATNVLRE